MITAKDFGKMMKKWGKSYKKPVFMWSKFLNEDLSEYAGKELQSWEVFKDLAMKRAGYRKIILAVAFLGETVKDEEHKQVGLKSYVEEDLHALIWKISERMRENKTSPFWELAGYTPEQFQKTGDLIKYRWALHPLNVAKAYGDIMKDIENWQDAVIRTFYFARTRSEIEQELAKAKGIKSKMVEKTRMAGLLKV